MCLYPRLLPNKKYLPNKKNNYNPPACPDERLRYVPIKCGNCIECRKAESREWRVRLEKEYINSDIPAKFVTLTFNKEIYEKWIKTAKTENEGATLLVRRFLERWRKETGKSVRHWLITEKGEDYARLHLHGLIWTTANEKTISEKWSYGFCYVGDYVNNKTINYITKYITKQDTNHPDFKGKKFVSPGIGRGYNTKQAYHKYIPGKTNDHIRLSNGQKIAMPIYYRNKAFTEDEREKLWLEKLDKNERYIRGIKFDMNKADDTHRFWKVLQQEQDRSRELGYKGPEKEWSAQNYGKTLKNLQYSKKENTFAHGDSDT